MYKHTAHIYAMLQGCTGVILVGLVVHILKWECML